MDEWVNQKFAELVLGFQGKMSHEHDSFFLYSIHKNRPDITFRKVAGNSNSLLF